MATGVLAVALGEATKTVPYAMDAEKTYRFTAAWGEARDSDDAEGKVTATSAVRPRSADDRGRAARASPANLIQVPPAYSAIKVQGERAYDLAREGETVTLEPRRSGFRGPRCSGSRIRDHAEFEMRMWQRDLRPGLGPGYRPGLRDFGPCFGAPADRHRRLFGRRRNSAGKAEVFYA